MGIKKHWVWTVALPAGRETKFEGEFQTREEAVEAASIPPVGKVVRKVVYK